MKHGPSQNLQCSYCQKIYKSMQALNRHACNKAFLACKNIWNWTIEIMKYICFFFEHHESKDACLESKLFKFESNFIKSELLKLVKEN